jgi:hypothetical protein
VLKGRECTYVVEIEVAGITTEVYLEVAKSAIRGKVVLQIVILTVYGKNDLLLVLVV